jgi:hypothetical protein
VHVLTKIFIVLVALLAVAIVPLVAVHATNEGTYKAKWAAEQGAAAAAANAYNLAKNEWTATQQSLEAKIAALEAELATARADGTRRAADIRRAETELAAAKAMQSQINSNLEIMTRTGQANQTMVASLVTEIKELRGEIVRVQADNVELDRVLAEVQNQLDVADAARKALQEEIQRITEEKLAMSNVVDVYRNTYGAIAGVGTGKPMAGATSDIARVPADRDLTATIVAVDRTGDTALAEIDAGSRDGVKPGWTLMIGKDNQFVANLRIIKVDVNRATGVIELESATRGDVAVGQRARASRGE